MTILNDAVSQEDDGTWVFRCPGFLGDDCGPFSTSGWPTRKSATARGAQHLLAHKEREPMQELHEFRLEHGLVPVRQADGSVKVEEL